MNSWVSGLFLFIPVGIIASLAFQIIYPFLFSLVWVAFFVVMYSLRKTTKYIMFLEDSIVVLKSKKITIKHENISIQEIELNKGSLLLYQIKNKSKEIHIWQEDFEVKDWKEIKRCLQKIEEIKPRRVEYFSYLLRDRF